MVLCPLGVEPNKPRAKWDERYINAYMRDIPFTMDNAAKVAEVVWKGAYMLKLDHTMVISMSQSMSNQGNILEFIGMENSMSCVFYHLTGNPAPTFPTF